MTEQRLRILQVNTLDTLGGAAKVARDLFHTYRARGYGSWLAVGTKLSTDPDVLLVPGQSGSPARHHWRPPPWLDSVARLTREPGKTLERFWGIEDFRFPGTWNLLTLAPEVDVVHCHNLHGHYFDLRVLPWLSQQLPVVLTLHDAWLLSGHCAHSLGCERWRTGCGSCPDLTLYPSIRRDATAYNWRRKQKIFEQSRLRVATPCRWLMRKVEQSILAAAVVEARVIPNGVDLSIFHPADKQYARSTVRIQPEGLVVVFAAEAVRQNVWKDYQTVQEAVRLTAEHMSGGDVLFVALGQAGPPERIGSCVMRFEPYETDPRTVACYYQAADVYVHAARADTFPNTILEALACATPVVATAVGGIPEQIEDGRTGFLVAPGDPHALAGRLTQLLSDPVLRARMGGEAAAAARRQFDLDRQADAYLAWYRELIHQRAAERPATGR